MMLLKRKSRAGAKSTQMLKSYANIRQSAAVNFAYLSCAFFTKRHMPKRSPFAAIIYGKLCKYQLTESTLSPTCNLPSLSAGPFFVILDIKIDSSPAFHGVAPFPPAILKPNPAESRLMVVEI